LIRLGGCRSTGTPPRGAADAFDEEVPDDLEISDNYVKMPDRRELDRGRRLTLRFAAQALSEHDDRAEACFRR
jgi:hypothetical protein